MMNLKRKFATAALSLSMVLTPAVAAVNAAPSTSLNSANAPTGVVLKSVKAKKGVKVYASKKVASRKKVAKKYAKAKSVKAALKGEKLTKGLKKNLGKLKKLSKNFARLYVKGDKNGKKSKGTKVTFKVNNLTKKAKKVYVLGFNPVSKKWTLTKTKVNYSKKTVSYTASHLGTYTLVYTK